jgi:hypothetical protein
LSKREKENIRKELNSDYIHYREVPTGKFIKKKLPVIDRITGEQKRDILTGQHIFREYNEPIREQKEISFDDVISIDLDEMNKSTSLPYLHGHTTTITNYLLRFWGAIIGAESAYLYILLLSYCYGSKYWCFVSMDTLCLEMKKSDTSIRKYLQILEDCGFVTRVWRKNPFQNKKNATIVFFVKRQIRIITSKQFAEIKDEEQRKKIMKDHFDFLENDLNFDKNEIESIDKMESTNPIDELLKKAVGVKTYEMLIKKYDIETSFYSDKICSSVEKSIWNSVLELVKTKWAESSYKSWLIKTVCKLYDDRVVLYVANNLAKDRIGTVFRENLIECLNEVTGDFSFDDCEFEIKLFEDIEKDFGISYQE